MTPKEFPEANVNFAADQPEYHPLPAFRDKEGNVVTCWQLSEEEKKKVQETGEIWLSTMTFNKPLQPVFLGTEKPLTPIAKTEPEPIPSCKCETPEYLNQAGVPEIYCQSCGLILPG